MSRIAYKKAILVLLQDMAKTRSSVSPFYRHPASALIPDLVMHPRFRSSTGSSSYPGFSWSSSSQSIPIPVPIPAFSSSRSFVLQDYHSCYDNCRHRSDPNHCSQTHRSYSGGQNGSPMTPHEPVAQAPARIQSCDSYTHEMPADSQAQVHFSDACQDGCTTLYPENARATQSAHRLHHQTHPHPHHPFHQSQFDGCHSGTSGLPFPVDNSQYTGAPTRPASEPLMPPSPSPDLSSLPSPQSTIDDDFGASPLLSSPTSSTEVATEVEIGSPRPYECPTCHIRFQRRHDLNRHCNIHSKERPFFCSRCQRRFVRRDALRRHQRMKNETRRFRCVATPQ